MPSYPETYINWQKLQILKTALDSYKANESIRAVAEECLPNTNEVLDNLSGQVDFYIDTFKNERVKVEDWFREKVRDARRQIANLRNAGEFKGLELKQRDEVNVVLSPISRALDGLFELQRVMTL
jgi:hypothetical protein